MSDMTQRNPKSEKKTSPSVLKLLGWLARREDRNIESTPRDVGIFTGNSPGAVTRQLTVMRKLGLIDTITSDTVSIKLTDEGRDTLEGVS